MRRIDQLLSDVALLDRTHRTMRASIAALNDRALERTSKRSTVTDFSLIAGVAAHDLYHAGQIQLLKRLMGRRGGRS